MTKEELKVMIDETINTNGARHITGKALNLALSAIVDSMEQRSEDEGSQRSDVNFFDYDGTLLYAYTWEEAKELTELPELPRHSDLDVRGWNYTLEDIKAQGVEGFFNQFGSYMLTGEVTINGTKYMAYTYSGIEENGCAYLLTKEPEPGDYVIGADYDDDEGEWEFWTNDDGSYYTEQVVGIFSKKGKADIGAIVYDGDNKVEVEGVYVFDRTEGDLGQFNDQLISVLSIPNTVYSIGDTFSRCTFLHEVKIPISVSDISNYYGAFQSCYLKAFWWNGNDRQIDFLNGNSFVSSLEIPHGTTYISVDDSCTDSIIYPNTTVQVMHIGNYGHSVVLHDFTNAKFVPELNDSSTWAMIYTRIVVPDELYDEWIESTNWSDWADYTYKLSESPWHK